MWEAGSKGINVKLAKKDAWPESSIESKSTFSNDFENWLMCIYILLKTRSRCHTNNPCLNNTHVFIQKWGSKFFKGLGDPNAFSYVNL